MPLIFACSVEAQQENVLAWWHLDEGMGMETREARHNAVFNIQTSQRASEWVDGVSGKALRSDGYSAFAKGRLEADFPENGFTLGGWFALESYPVDTAAFIAIFDDRLQNGVELALDKFGFPLAIFTRNGQETVVARKKPLEKFQWLHLALTWENGTSRLLVNGEMAAEGKVFGLKKDCRNIWLGKRPFEKTFIDKFPLQVLNGILDEITLWKPALSAGELSAVFKKEKPIAAPDLSIPASRFEGDFHRPKYHALPPAAWTNETHGLIRHKGVYHIFYQKNAAGPYWSHINWGHLSSPDLLRWSEHPPVLSPEPGYDQFGIWSGHAIEDENGQPVIIYTSGDGKNFGMSLAYPLDNELIKWKKYEGNPVIPSVPQGFQRSDFRDPWLWQEGGFYYLIIGFGIEDGGQGGAVLLYKSKNLKDWQYLRPMHSGYPAKDDSGIFWEMPVFPKIGEKRVLLVNKVPEPGKPAEALYWIGEFKNERFTPDFETPKPLEIITGMLSPSMWHDEAGRLFGIAIIPDEISKEAQYRQGWSHLYSIPRLWEIKGETLVQTPHPVLQTLRGRHLHFENVPLKNGIPDGLGIAGHQLEIKVVLRKGTASKAGVLVGKSADGQEFTKIEYDFANARFTVDRTRSSLDPDANPDVKTGRFPEKGMLENIALHLFIDGSVVEVFVNGEAAFTTRMFPAGEQSKEVAFFAEGGEAVIEEMDVWNLENN